MKKIFNTSIFFFILFLTFAFSILTDATTFNSKSIDLAECIKNINHEAVVLALNNGQNGEISSRQGKNNHIFSSSSHLIANNHTNNNLFGTKNYQINKSFNNNLLANSQKSHLIRAP